MYNETDNRPGSYVAFLPSRIQLKSLNSTLESATKLLPHFRLVVSHSRPDVRHQFKRHISAALKLISALRNLRKDDANLNSTNQ